jgi:hypothetical protein
MGLLIKRKSSTRMKLSCWQSFREDWNAHQTEGRPDDEKVKSQALKLPYIIPAEVEAYPPEVPTVRECKQH